MDSHNPHKKSKTWRQASIILALAWVNGEHRHTVSEAGAKEVAGHMFFETFCISFAKVAVADEQGYI